jgi:hypothetical protein
MGKYENLHGDVFSVFGSQSWLAENIKTIPSNFNTANIGNEYIRISVVPSGYGINYTSSSGQLLIDIFTPAGSGPTRSAQIADRLDAYLVGKSITLHNGRTQFGKSSLSQFGPDGANPALFRSIYSISFNFFGV